MRKEKEEYVTSPELISRLEFIFIKFKIGGSFEDFYHDYVVYIYEGRGAHQTLDHYAIDCIRSKLGRFGGKAALANALNVDDLFESDDNNQRISPSYVAFVKNLLNKYKGRNRIIINLYFVYGFNQPEISELLRVTPSRIAQIITSIRSEGSLEDCFTVNLDPEEEIHKLKLENLNLKKKLKRVFREKIVLNNEA